MSIQNCDLYGYLTKLSRVPKTKIEPFSVLVVKVIFFFML